MSETNNQLRVGEVSVEVLHVNIPIEHPWKQLRSVDIVPLDFTHCLPGHLIPKAYVPSHVCDSVILPVVKHGTISSCVIDSCPFRGPLGGLDNSTAEFVAGLVNLSEGGSLLSTSVRTDVESVDSSFDSLLIKVWNPP